ncbi:hypothetical protein Ddc_14196 [Ditylenchus destructor]|nr:hypothetical protein Ddc_14196 [Ditylenchus destructor]
MTNSRKPNLNGSIICCIFALLLHSSKAQSPYTTKTFSGNVNQVISRTNGGDIFVAGNASLSEHKVEMYVKSNDGTELSNDEIQQRLDKYYTVKIDFENGVLNATATQNSSNQELSISFVVDVASETVSTELKTSGGNLSVRRIFGNTKGQTSGGNIEVANCGGENNAVALSTSGGNVNVANCTGRLMLRTSGGDLGLVNLTGTINARTSGGNIRASALNGNITVRTSGGNLDLSDVSGGLSAITTGGNIVTSMTKVTGDTRLKTSGGSVDFSFPSGHYNLTLTGDTVDVSGLNNFNGTQTQKSVKGQMNGGGTPIVAAGDTVSVKIKDEESMDEENNIEY